jgi:GxxExxY protein
VLESTYEVCVAYLLSKKGYSVRTQVALPVIFKDIKLDAGYRLDMLVDEEIIVELKAVDAVAPIHTAQLLTYLKLSEKKLGLLINFNVVDLKTGIHRLIN